MVTMIAVVIAGAVSVFGIRVAAALGTCDGCLLILGVRPPIRNDAEPAAAWAARGLHTLHRRDAPEGDRSPAAFSAFPATAPPVPGDRATAAPASVAAAPP